MARRFRSVVVQRVEPEIDGGRYAVKRVVGDTVAVTAELLREGHDELAGHVWFRPDSSPDWASAPLARQSGDRWGGAFTVDQIGRWRYTIVAWPDLFRTWRRDLLRRLAAGEPIEGERLEGVRMIAQAAARATGRDGYALRQYAARAEASVDPAAFLRVIHDIGLTQLLDRYPEPARIARYCRELPLVVDRVAARFAAWYELFPRSQGRTPGQSGNLRDVMGRLREIRAMGFDVLYLTPIHPIGQTNRKGPNNALVAGPSDPGSPYAIGSATGGHTAIHPELGDIEDFDQLVALARAQGMEVALDFAIQASPDHPWVTTHPEWFYHRPDGAIRYAENPPKKYQDIYPFNFHGPHQADLHQAWLDVLRFWIGHGVKTFRVDNPHTKPIDFWEWLIAEVKRDHPDVIFLSEAFTKDSLMRLLAKVGFSQSYTYFTWKNEKGELIDYLSTLTQSDVRDYFRANLFANTPDILSHYLQRGGPPAFKIRAVLAATLSSVYGIYSGFELCENTPRGDSEYYLDSEMYQHKVWDWDRPGNIKGFLARLNRARRENPALHGYDNLRFYDADNPNVLWYGKMTATRDNVILAAVNLDPRQPQAAHVAAPIGEIGLSDDATYQVEDLLTDQVYTWRGARNWVHLDPATQPAHLFRVKR